MKKILKLSLAALLFALSGCYMHTATSSHYYYPPGTYPENADYHLWIEFHGAKRKPFVDKTNKKIIIGINKQKNRVLLREYELVAADINSDVSWEELGNLNITFFDFDEGVSIYDRDLAHRSGKIIFTLHFTFDPDRGVFIESPINEELKRKIRKEK